VRRLATLLAALLLAAGCGGGDAASPTSPSPSPEDSSALVALDSSNFDALVLASLRPGLVEFHRPT
jgi:hypothetical protein